MINTYVVSLLKNFQLGESLLKSYIVNKKTHSHEWVFNFELVAIYPAVFGLITFFTSDMLFAGNPPVSACCLISSSLSAL